MYRLMFFLLKKEETTYNHLFNKARMELAVQCLKNPRFAVGEIAYLLHYSEPSVFQASLRDGPDCHRDSLGKFSLRGSVGKRVISK